MAMLKRCWWPGNIRELGLIERLVAVSDKEFISEGSSAQFHFETRAAGSHGESLFEEATNTFERNFILRRSKVRLERHWDC